MRTGSLAGEVVAARRPGGLARTIAAYDATAAEYTRRFRHVELRDDLDRFAALAVLDAPIIDAGCGHGRDCAALGRRRLSAIGIDLSAALLRSARGLTNAPLVRGDVRGLPVASSSIGGVWCCAVLLHLDEDDFRRAVEEFARVLKPEAPLFVAVRHGAGEELRPDPAGAGRWFKFYSRFAVHHLIRQAGFDIRSCDVLPGVSHGEWVNVHAVRAVGGPRRNGGDL